MRSKSYDYNEAKRRNIPTEEDAPYLSEDEKDNLFCPEPAGTDGPKLSWRRGAGAANSIATDALPLFIHEKISPSAFVAQVTKSNGDEGQTSLFEDFNGLPADAKYEWYRHRANWQNRIIRGNSIDVMASLAVKEGMEAEVQTIYFDPPYGITFSSNYQTSSRERKKSGPPIEPNSIRVFRDAYVDGVHSYLDTILKIAVHGRSLLKMSGSLFLQISTEHVHRIAVVLDEVFGSENRVATIAFAKTGSKGSKHLDEVGDWLLWYAKDKERLKFHQLYEVLSRKEKIDHFGYNPMVELEDGSCRELTGEEKSDPEKFLPCGDARIWSRAPFVARRIKNWEIKSLQFKWKYLSLSAWSSMERKRRRSE